VTEALIVAAYILVGACVAGYAAGRFELTSEDGPAVPVIVVFWPLFLFILAGAVFFRLGTEQRRKHEA
jgi:lipopolysaccharide export LptBFGC system permease protein LptF